MTAEAPFPTVSVILPTYARDNPHHLAEAIDSILCQTEFIAELLVVADGPLPDESWSIIDQRVSGSEKMRVIALPENLGLPHALSAGVEAATGTLIARMDADDISHPDRMVTQLRFLRENTQIAVVGAQILEFESVPSDGSRVRQVPLDHNSIRRLSRVRNPMNHVSVMARRDAILQAGSYEEWRGFEDYHLWAKMISRGFRFANLPQTLVSVRTQGLYKRRGGLTYIKDELAFRRELVSLGISTRGEFLVFATMAVGMRIAPESLRKWVYNHLLRSNQV